IPPTRRTEPPACRRSAGITSVPSGRRVGGDLRDRGPLEPALPVQAEGCPFQALERDVAGAAIAGPRVAGAQAALAYAERGVRTSIVRLALENTPGCWRRSRPDPRCST